METHNAHTLLNRFNETIQKWIDYLDDYTLEMLWQKPQPHSWSLGQMYVHILDDTAYFVEQMKAALANNANSEKEMHEDAKAMFSKNQFPDIRIEGPATYTPIEQPQSKEQLLKPLVSLKAEVNALFSTFDGSRTRGKTQHPGLLYFSALEWLQFAEMHMRHHFRQKQRLDQQFP